MTPHARCVAPDNTLVEVAGLMRQLDIGAIPVLENDLLAGMVTDRDIVVRGVADGRDPNTAQVRDVMSNGIVSIFADQSVEEAVRLMEQKQIRRLPVLSREHRLLGIVALGDIAVASNPAFSGMALREVSESEQTMSHRGSRPSTPGQRLSTPRAEGSAERTGSPPEQPDGSGRNGSTPEAGSRGTSAARKQPVARAKTGARAQKGSGRKHTAAPASRKKTGKVAARKKRAQPVGKR